MNKKWIGINLILLFVVGMLGWRLYVSVKQFNADNELAKVQPAKEMTLKAAAQNALSQPLAPKVYNAAEFAIIPEQNVFSEFRARDEKTDTAAVPEIPPLAQKPILVGVNISGKDRSVSIIDPLNPGRRSQTKRLGDVYQGYTITDITEDQMVLESGTRKEIIPLHSGSKRQGQAGKTAIIATRVVAFGQGGTAGGANTPGIQVVSGSPASAQPRPATPTPQPPVQAAAPVANQPAQAARQAAGAAVQPAPAWNERTNDQGQRIIRTPFGDIVRPAQ